MPYSAAAFRFTLLNPAARYRPHQLAPIAAIGGIGRIVHEDRPPLRQREVLLPSGRGTEFESATLVGAVERLPVIGRAEEGYFIMHDFIFSYLYRTAYAGPLATRRHFGIDIRPEWR